MIQLLVVEDDRLIGEMVRLNLEREGYAVTWARDGAEGERAALAGGHDLLLLDVMLPGRSGFDIGRAVRAAGLRVPILMLTARSDTASKVTGLDAGADDYLTKPFDVAELMARVRALLRRAGVTSTPPARGKLALGGSAVDLDSGDAETLSGPARLAPEELRLLDLLVRRRGQVITAGALAAELSATGGAPWAGDDVIRTIATLRGRFEPDADRPRFFLYIPPGSYRFEH